MNVDAARLVVRLLALQLAVHAVTFLLTAAFAPRVLLLEPASTAASLSVVAVVGLSCSVFSTVLTLALTRRLRPALRSLSVGTEEVLPADVLGLHALPARLAFASAAFALLLSLATLVPGLRPQALDAYTALTLVLLTMTMVSTAALPSYVTMRASIARVLELLPPQAASEALLGLGRGALGRLRTRFVAAVAAPVAFVALGASLLVDAHARTYDRDARVADATDFARAVFEPVEGASPSPAALLGEARARDQVIAAAASLGFRVRFAPSLPGELTVKYGAEGETQVIVPTPPGAAVVRFGASQLSPVTGIYALLALVAVALAALLGTRIGAAFEFDLGLATREMRRAGVAEVMRGTIILHEARFRNVHALLEAVDALGGVFREFAGAQQRSIDAREATERMRGLLLASMSHDLKAPLNAVLGFAELVGRNPLSSPQQESLAIIEQRGRELLMLIDTILDSARAEAGELEVAPEPTHVGDIVMASVLEARDLAVGTDVQIQGEVQPGMPTLLLDGTRIVQALTAVVMTAARFTDKGVVPVRATLPDRGERLRVEVETSGEGLPVGEREKIFDAFKSAESARRHGGLGLGLQLARSILEIHGGSIEVDTTDRGGMVFRIWLPVHNDGAAIRARASRPAAPSP
jgi:signal transduction histidine kinase